MPIHSCQAVDLPVDGFQAVIKDRVRAIALEAVVREGGPCGGLRE